MPAMTELKQSPLHSLHLESGARLVPFAGWEMPVQYGSILQEHRSVRESAGLFDVSHMGELEVTGPDAGELMDTLITNNLAQLKDHRGLYTPMCYPTGGVVDDLVIYRMANDCYFLCVNAANTAKDYTWICENRGQRDARVLDCSSEYALLALQGPRTFDILGKLGCGRLQSLRRFALSQTSIDGMSVIVSRSGYTGEDGVELYTAWSQGEHLARLLLDAGRNFSLVLCGLGARDSLRLEAGLALYGHEIDEDISPLEAGLGWTVKFKKKRAFIGREVLQAQKQHGATRSLIHFRLPGRRIARPGHGVYQGDILVGKVTSGTMSPLSNQPIGSALVKSAAAKSELTVLVRGHRIDIEIAKPPLHIKNE